MNKGLDAYALRQRVTAQNIANEDTPHYRPQRVKFEELFQNEQVTLNGETTDSRHIPMGITNENDVKAETAQASLPTPEVYFSGQSHVDIDKEMSDLAQNQIRFRFTTQMVKKYFTDLSQSIRGMSQ